MPFYWYSKNQSYFLLVHFGYFDALKWCVFFITVLDFKKNVYELYRDHIEELQSISVNELEQLVIPEDTEVVGRILSDVKEAVQTQVDAGEDIKREQDLNDTEPVTQETDFIMDEEETKAADAYTTEEDDGLDFIDKLDKVDKD